MEGGETPYLVFHCPAGYPESCKLIFEIECDSYSQESAALMPVVRKALSCWLDEQEAGEQMAFLLACELQEILSQIANGEGDFGCGDAGGEAGAAGDDFEQFPEKPVALFFDPEFVEAMKRAAFKPGRLDSDGKVWVWSYYSKSAGDIQLTGQAADYAEYLCSPYDILLEHNQLDKESCAQFFYFRYKDSAHGNKSQFAKDIVCWAEEQVNNMNDHDEEDDDVHEEADETMIGNITGNMPSIEEINKYFEEKGIPPVTMVELEKRPLSIFSWGSRFYKSFGVLELKSNGVDKDNNVNACILNGSHSGNADNNGTTLRIQRNVACGGNFRDFMLMSISKIERRNLSVLGVNCAKGRHRSVAVACLLNEYYYKSGKVKHLTLKRAE